MRKYILGTAIVSILPSLFVALVSKETYNYLLTKSFFGWESIPCCESYGCGPYWYEALPQSVKLLIALALLSLPYLTFILVWNLFYENKTDSYPSSDS